MAESRPTLRRSDAAALRRLFRRLAVLAVPGITSSIACPGAGPDDVDVLVPVEELVTQEELVELCGDVPWQQCSAICERAMSAGRDACLAQASHDDCTVESCALEGSAPAPVGDVSDAVDMASSDDLSDTDDTDDTDDMSDTTTMPPAMRSGVVAKLHCVCSSIAGRRTAGLELDEVRGSSVGCVDEALGSWLAGLVYEEAAAVHAFARLAEELAQHGAPAELIEGSRQAAREEVLHVALASSLATSLGVTPQAPRLAPLVPRPLVEIAKENAAEGCVGEAFAALLATVQARTARLPEVRALMARIAHDETGHAAFSFALDAWLAERLDEDGRAQVAAARHAALERLRGLAADYPPALREAVGVPAPDALATLLESFAAVA